MRKVFLPLFLSGFFFPPSSVVAVYPASNHGPADPVRVVIRTEVGDIRVEVYPDLAPKTVANFLRYVDEGFYDGGTFHRTVHRDNQPTDSVRIAVIQGDTATSSFFICLGDQPELNYGGRRNPDGQGFAAFGMVVEGLDVVRAVHRSPAEGQSLAPPIRIISVARAPR